MRSIREIASSALLCVIVLALSAHVASADTATVFIAANEFEGGGQQRVFESRNSTFTVSGGERGLRLELSGGSVGDTYAMRFSPPPGGALAAGVYAAAVDADTPRAGRPGISVDAQTANSPGGCGLRPFGDFEVKDIAFDAGGVLSRLWLVYSQGCGVGGPKHLFGEIRLGEADSGEPLSTIPAMLRWPEVDRGHAGATMPITVRAVTPATVGAVAIAGAGASAFQVRVNECAGLTLAAGDSCRVWVRFTPGAAGTHRALLTVGGAGSTGTPLEGFAYGGRTALTMTSDPGEFVGQGRTWSFTSDDAIIAARRSPFVPAPHDVLIDVDGSSRWHGRFTPADGDVLVPGFYGPLFHGPGAALSPMQMGVGGDSRSCNNYDGDLTVQRARYDADGAPIEFAASFNQACHDVAGQSGTLHGTFEFRAGDTTALPSWLTGQPPTTPPGPGEPPGPGDPPPGTPPIAAGANATNTGTDAGLPTTATTTTPRAVRVVALITGRRLTASARDIVTLRLRCPVGTRRCRGTIALADRRGRALGRTRYDVTAGAGATIRLPLSRGARLRTAGRPLAVHLRFGEDGATLVVRNLTLRGSRR